MEMTSYSSVLTITAFTVERYIAICHPIKLQKVCHVSRAIRCIIVIWTISSLSALPYPVHTRMFYYLLNPETGHSIPDSLVCNIPLRWVGRMLAVFQVSALIYFILPMVVITVLYILIGIRLRKTELSSQCSSGGSQGKSTATRARRAVLKMLVAVVVAFFVCWAPFHAQRLMSLYVTEWTQALLDMHGHLFYVSGVLYFLSSTVNPILYNLLSRKFRQAFKRTLCRCCLNFNTMPTFYKLKAKFINNNDQPVPSSASDGMYLNPNKNSIRMATFYRVEKPNTLHSYRNGIIDHPSTRDTQLNRTSWSSTCSSHAHSDGGLHYLCRHKRCMNRRQSQLTPRQNCQIASYQDIDSLRRKEPETPRRREPTNTLTLDDSITSADERPPVPVLRIRLDI